VCEFSRGRISRNREKRKEEVKAIIFFNAQEGGGKKGMASILMFPGKKKGEKGEPDIRIQLYMVYHKTIAKEEGGGGFLQVL